MSAPRCIRPSIFLEYGVDAICAEDAACEICERGMRFRARWQFSPGTMLQISFAFEEGAPERMEIEGLVIESLAAGENEYRTTLAFVDPPCEFRASLGKLASPLKFHRADPR